MKLFHSTASPFVRKVLVTAFELNMSERLHWLPSAAHPVNRDATVAAFNPTGKVPTLITDDNVPLYDSRVICEYLDGLDGKGRIFPAAGPARWRALREQALGDGLLEAAVHARYEMLVRPKECFWQPMLDGLMRKIHSSVDSIDACAPGFGERFDIGTLPSFTLLGLDIRFFYHSSPGRNVTSNPTAEFFG